MGKDFVVGLPFLLFVAREAVQETLGFSPAELVFGHSKGTIKAAVWTFVGYHLSIFWIASSFKERLNKACAVAKAHLSAAQSKMKQKFDKKSVRRNLQVGYSVLVLLLVLLFKQSYVRAKAQWKRLCNSNPWSINAKQKCVMWICLRRAWRGSRNLFHLWTYHRSLSQLQWLSPML